MIQESILFGYIAFGSLKKLIKHAELLSVLTHFPYVTVTVELPFELQETVLTLFKEDLRGAIKKKQYKVFEMVPHVAMDYAKHKNLKLEIISEDPVITLIEFDTHLVQIEEGLEIEEIQANFNFDLVDIYASRQGATYSLTFACGPNVKELKKVVKNSLEFDAIAFLKGSSVLARSSEALASRGEELLSYFSSIFAVELQRLGFEYMLDNPDDKDKILTPHQGQLYEDPLVLRDLLLQGRFLVGKFALSAKKINSCLKSLIKILKMLLFNFRLEVFGTFSDQELKDITLEISDIEYQKSSARFVELKVEDSFHRFVTVCRFNLFKKSVEFEVDLLKVILTHLQVHKKLYPDMLPRPLQTAVVGDLAKHEELLKALLDAKLKGASGFVLEQKDLISDKQALDYQIDKLVYYSVSDGLVKERSF